MIFYKFFRFCLDSAELVEYYFSHFENENCRKQLYANSTDSVDFQNTIWKNSIVTGFFESRIQWKSAYHYDGGVRHLHSVNFIVEHGCWLTMHGPGWRSGSVRRLVDGLTSERFLFPRYSARLCKRLQFVLNQK